MGDINSFTGVVKILETPQEHKVSSKIFLTKFRVQFSQVRKNKTNILHLIIWGKLGREIAKYYTINDYVLIEGYLSIRDTQKQLISSSQKERRKIQITVSKIYPFNLILNSNQPL